MSTTTRRPGRRGLLRVHAWLIVTATVATIVSASSFALTRPSSYVAQAQVAVAPELVGGTALRPEMASEREIATSGTVTTRAANRLGLAPREASDGLSVSVVIESSVLNIRYAADSSEAASTGARTFAQTYVDYRNALTDGTRIARIVTWPDIVERSGVNLPLVLGVALLAGLVLGVGAAWARDRIADRVRDPDELADHSGLPLFAEIPRWRSYGSIAPEGSAHESFGYVAARLDSLVSHRRGDVSIVVTSPRPGAGTTTVALNTALALAEQGRDVVLVDADLRNPRLHEIVDVPEAPGLLEVLDGECTLEDVLRQTRWPNLSAVALGTPPDTGSMNTVSLQPDMLGLVLGQLSSRAIVVIDAPPLLESAASLVLADKAYVVLLVGDLRSGRRNDVERAMRLIDGIQPSIDGWVANLPRRSRRAERDGSAFELRTMAGTRASTDDRPDRVAS